MENIQAYLILLKSNLIFLALDFLKYFLASFFLLVSSQFLGKFLRNRNKYLTHSAALIAVILSMISFSNFILFITSMFLALIFVTSATWGRVATKVFPFKKVALVSLIFFILFTLNKQLFNGHSQYYSLPIIISSEYIGREKLTFYSMVYSEPFEVGVYMPKEGARLINIYDFNPLFIGHVVIIRGMAIDSLHFIANVAIALFWGYILNRNLPLHSRYSNILNSMFVSFMLTFFFIIFW